MNEYDLFDAIGGIDADLLQRSENRKTTRRIPFRKALIAAAAVMALTVTVFAAPKLKELLFGSEITQISKGIMYVDNENGICFSKDAAYEVDMTLPCAETAPQFIEEHRLPTYFEENNWSCDHSFVTPEDNYFGVHYLFSIPDAPQYWVIFKQAPFSHLEPRGRRQFLMNAGRTGIVTEHSFAIGDVEGTLYVVEPSEAGGEPGLKNVIWSDGSYAYLLECGYEVTDKMIAEIVLSLAPLEDITPYLPEPDPEIPEKPLIPIETFYTLTDISDSYTLTERRWDVDFAAQHWERSEEASIDLYQERNVTTAYFGTTMDITSTLAEVMTSLNPYEYETAKDNGQLYHIFYYQGDTFAMWETEEYIFQLRFNGQKLSVSEMLVHLDNVQPMPDFSDHLTE